MERLRLARVSLVAKFPYFAPVAYLLTFVETDKLETMTVDDRGRLFYNPHFVNALEDRELLGVFWHEVNHVVRNHIERAAALADLRRANLAADMEVNDDAEEAGIVLPKGRYGAVYPESRGLPRGLTMEAYYRLLEEEEEEGGGEDQVRGFDEPLSPSGKGAPWEAEALERGEEGLPPSSFDVARVRVAEEVVKHHQAKGASRGKVPRGLLRWAKETLSPKVSWRSVFRRLVRGGLAEPAKRRRPTYARPNRRAQSYHPYVLPGSYAFRPRVAVVVDTSGSVSQVHLGQALGELKEILKAVREVWVYVTDAEVHEVRKVWRADQVVLRGGGGTDMRVGIARALERRPHLVVVLTDGQTPWPEKPLPVPVVAALLPPSEDGEVELYVGPPLRRAL